MYILDTDILRLIFHHPGQQLHLEKRLMETPPELIWISVVTVREIMRGALDLVKKDERANNLVRGYDFLLKLFSNLARFQILPFDQEAETIYRAMSPQTKRLGTNDCQIAASALALNFTVITRNTKDFQRIPNVKFANWTNNR